MPTKYSDNLLRAVLGARSTSPLGMRLGRACAEAELPAVYVAQVLGVTRMTVHNWFRGGVIRKSRVEKLIVFMKLVQEDMAKGVLPKKNLADARAYLQEMCDTPLKPVVQKKG